MDWAPGVVERWRAIPDSRGYEVSSEGRIKHGDRVLRGCVYSTGYIMQVIYLRDGSKRRVAAHTLVCEAFHGPRPDEFECCHINGIKTDNRASNLRWGSRADNMRDQYRHGTRVLGDRHPCAKLTYDIADRMRRRNRRGEGAGRLAREYGVSKKAVQNLLRGKTWRRPEALNSEPVHARNNDAVHNTCQREGFACPDLGQVGSAG